MKHAAVYWDDIRAKLADKDIFLFCDFDGTLTPIRPRPGLAILGLQRRKFLESLVRLSGVKLAFVSGRGLADLKEKVPVTGAFYAGNHGLEASGPGIEFLAPLPSNWRKSLSAIKRLMLPLEKTFPGILIEDKGLTLSMHYRRVSVRKQAACHKAITDLASDAVKSGKIFVHGGKKVFEIRPPVVWHKGSIVRWILEQRARPRTIPVFIGDDVTDEDAFKAIRSRGIAIHVGKNRKTAAQYHLDSVMEVYGLLKNIRSIKT